MDASTSSWIRALDGEIRDRLAKLGLAEARVQRMTLGPFLEQYIAGRTTAKSGTLDTYQKAKKSLIEHVGADRKLKPITRSDAEKWRIWLATQSNSRDKDRNSLADSTVHANEKRRRFVDREFSTIV